MSRIPEHIVEQQLRRFGEQASKKRQEEKNRDALRESALRHAHAREKAHKHYGDERRAKE